MAKIALERTIESAYRFAFTKFLSVLGVLWLPLLAVCALIAAVAYFAWGDISRLSDMATRVAYLPDTGDALTSRRLDTLLAFWGMAARFGGLIFLAVVLARAMVTVGVLRKALGLHDGPVFAYFSLGAPVWRMAGAMILATIVIAASVLATIVAAGLLLWANQYMPDSARLLIRAIVIAAAICWTIYMALRLVFFLPAVVVAENSMDLTRAWRLGGGNFWRMVIVLVAVVLPVMIVSGIVSNAIFGTYLWMQIRDAVLSGQSVPPGRLFSSLAQSLGAIWPAWAVFELIYLALLTGLGLGAVAAAYRSVTDTGVPA
ncbi:MAG TPA: hypothetical protein VG819_04960 [Rhizomicrobium sp.]|jgi:hypothetical protein|nr:hypothetical protein [Rhizomicrobium sp.]